MRQPDRRRALLPGGSGSDWDFEFYAARGVLPSSDKMSITLYNPSVASQSTSGFENGFYRLNGVTSSQEGGIAIRTSSSFLAAKCESECAFYIRRFSKNNLAYQSDLRTSTGMDLMVRIQSGSISVFEQRGSTISKQSYSRQFFSNTRYVIRCDIDSENNIAHVYINDELVMTKTTNFVENSYLCTTQLIALSGGSNMPAQLDIEYFKYRRL